MNEMGKWRDDGPGRKSSYWKIPIILLFLFLAMPITYVAIVFRINADRLEGDMDAIRRAGEPFTLTEIEPPPVPPSENAAPSYNQAVQKLEKEKLREDTKGGILPTDKELQAARGWIEANEECLKYLDRAIEHPKCRFDLDYARGFAMLIDPQMEMRELAELKAVRAVLFCLRGDTEKAVKDLEGGLVLARHLNEEPLLISFLLRLGRIKIATNALEKCLRVRKGGASHFVKLLPALEKMELSASLKKAQMGERAIGIDVFDQLREGHITLLDVSGGTCSAPSPRSIPETIGHYVYRKFLLSSDELAYLRIMARTIEIADRPYVEIEKKLKPLEREVQLLARQRHITSSFLLSGIVMSKVKATSRRARLDLARLAILAECYKEKTNRYPDRLDALVGEGLAEVPKDPFSSKPYRYKRRGDGRILYSVGENGIDDGGRPGQTDSEGDLVWTLGALTEAKDSKDIK
jgi:hypothetical protein